MADSSTIDFAYIPDFDPEARREPEKLRVPILPFTNASEATLLAATEAEEPVCFTPPLYCWIALCCRKVKQPLTVT